MDEQRRKFLVGAGLAGTAVATALAPNMPTAAEAQAAPQAPAAKSEPEGYVTLTSAEAAFFSAVLTVSSGFSGLIATILAPAAAIRGNSAS